MKLNALALLGAVPFVVLGCNSQPVAPSALPAAASTAPTAAVAASDAVATTRAGGRTGAIGTVFVTSQGLYYDTFVTADPLPFHGKFQKLENGKTMYGPGQPGYLGGRWWEDTDGDNVQDPTDHYFLCPLLPPGRPTP